MIPSTQSEFQFMDRLWREKIEAAIELIRISAASGMLNVMHSGGKDSVVIAKLTEMTGLPHRRIYNVTTMDPPELVRFVRTCNVEMHHPGTSFIKLVEQKGLPTRWRRWCCEHLKHKFRPEGVSIIGIRAEESAARKDRWKCVQVIKHKYIICPILNWSTEDVWTFIHQFKLPYCCLYDQGWKRIGCVGCPLSGHPHKELDHYPRMKENIRKAWWKYSETHTVDDVQRAWDGWLLTGKLCGEQSAPEDEECLADYLLV
jgi:phosphoadenosine phosphosulfate reductase